MQNILTLLILGMVMKSVALIIASFVIGFIGYAVVDHGITHSNLY